MSIYSEQKLPAATISPQPQETGRNTYGQYKQITKSWVWTSVRMKNSCGSQYWDIYNFVGTLWFLQWKARKYPLVALIRGKEEYPL